ncbi:Multi antimicrobial extrusion (MATE) family transporter [Streptococcus sp. DD11]|uniref:MATE family efflux transporter n=1 Tax=Streptococcus sp. DD11 TaxID=1777879 RepID=UPI000797C7BC|nr:MATE family efflux transporter [Streptococcus sp. DD11]KXT78932.1 Multi antimicrobial extrusion (MATE) family transporter [Streptococcus sp. DD11]
MKKEKDENKSIWEIALPVTLENILQTSVGAIDAWIVARLGLTMVAAVGIANSLISVYIAVFIALSVGATALVSQRIGAKDYAKARIFVSGSLILGTLFGLVLGLLTLLFGQDLLSLMGAEDQIKDQAYHYFSWVGGTALLIALMTLLSSFLRTAGLARFPLYVSLGTNIANLLLSYLLAFGTLGFPAMGLTGVALGTVLARLLASLILFYRLSRTDLWSLRMRIPALEEMKELVTITLPALLERLAMRLGQVLYMGIIVSISAKVYAAHSIAGTIESFTYMPAYGLAAAASILIGKSTGEGDKVAIRRIARKTVSYGISIMSAFALILFLFAEQLGAVYTQNPEALSYVAIALRISALAQPFLAISLIMAGALQGTGDTKSPLYSTLFGMWGIRVLGVLYLGKTLAWGITGIWMAVALDLVLRSLILLYRFSKVKECPID